MGIYGPRTVFCIALKDAPGTHEFLLQARPLSLLFIVIIVVYSIPLRQKSVANLPIALFPEVNTSNWALAALLGFRGLVSAGLRSQMLDGPRSRGLRQLVPGGDSGRQYENNSAELLGQQLSASTERYIGLSPGSARLPAAGRRQVAAREGDPRDW